MTDYGKQAEGGRETELDDHAIRVFIVGVVGFLVAAIDPARRNERTKREVPRS
jgi:hypothetical protein